MPAGPEKEVEKRTHPAPRAPVAGLPFALAWPVLIWIGLRATNARVLALTCLALLAALGLAALAIGRRRNAASGLNALPAATLLPMAVLALLGGLSNDSRWLLSVPVVASLAAAAVFGHSLRPGAIPLIERFARAMGTPPPGAEAHCRHFTIAWTVLLLVSAALAGWFAMVRAVDAWALWTGVGSYVGMALLFALERGLRYLRFERRGAGNGLQRGNG